MKIFWMTGIVIFGVFLIGIVIRICHNKKQMRDRAAKEEAERIYEEKIRKQKEQEQKERERQKRAEEEKKKLAEVYWMCLQQEEQGKENQKYTRIFVRYAEFYQTVFGLLRRRCMEPDFPEGYLLSEMEIIVNNSGIRQALNDDKFQVKLEKTDSRDKEQVVKQCMGCTIDALKREIEKKQKDYERESGTERFRIWITQTVPLVSQLLTALDEEDVPALVNSMEKIAEVLKMNGCLPIFACDPEVTNGSNLRFDFADVPPDATELPALYTLESSGDYSMVGQCIGTRRSTV